MKGAVGEDTGASSLGGSVRQGRFPGAQPSAAGGDTQSVPRSGTGAGGITAAPAHGEEGCLWGPSLMALGHSLPALGLRAGLLGGVPL